MILADTTFLVDILRKKVNTQSLDGYKGEFLFISEISIFELYYGLFSNKILSKSSELLKKRSNLIKKLVSKFQVLSFGRKESIESAKILASLKLEGKPIELRDGLIAGIAKANGINEILTRDVGLFSRIAGITEISY